MPMIPPRDDGTIALPPIYSGPPIDSTVPGITFPLRGGSKLESFLTKLLDEAGIPSFIWGEPMLSILGVPTGIFFNGFVIPDDLIENAAKVLDEAKLPPCKLGAECQVFWEGRDYPYPDYHWHVDLQYTEKLHHMTCGVFVYRKTRLFWKYPDPTVGRPAPDDPYYMLTSDARIQNVDETCRGRSRGNLYPVKMLIPARYLEAIILLKLRDHDQRTMHWGAEYLYLIGVVELGVNIKLEDLAEPFHELVRRYIDKSYYGKVADMGGHKFFEQLRKEMKSGNQLPPPEIWAEVLKTIHAPKGE